MVALFCASFIEGGHLNVRGQLGELASGLGLDVVGEAPGCLEYGDGADEVLASQEAAGRLGIVGVPFYVFDGRWTLTGAQPVEVFGHVIDTARGERVT